jgi:uncharacterized protein (TIGR02147 family)
MRPYVYEYESHRDYLRDLLKWMSIQESKYSLRWLSKRIGFSSPSMLSMSLSGKRTLPLDKLVLAMAALKLLPDEIEYMRAIYEIETCDDPLEIKRLKDQKRIKFHDGLFLDLPPEASEVYSAWYLPALREMIILEGFKADPFWMASQLGISPVEARDGMMTLIRIGMVRANNGRYERSIPSIQPKIPPQLITEYTKIHIDRSKNIFGIDRKSRYANTLTLAVSKSGKKQIRKILARLISEIDTLAETDDTREDLVQLNLQFYSLIDFANLK